MSFAAFLEDAVMHCGIEPSPLLVSLRIKGAHGVGVGLNMELDTRDYLISALLCFLAKHQWWGGAATARLVPPGLHYPRATHLLHLFSLSYNMDPVGWQRLGLGHIHINIFNPKANKPPAFGSTCQIHTALVVPLFGAELCCFPAPYRSHKGQEWCFHCCL